MPQCDAIVVMDEGKITESGSYDELLEKDGKLAEIVKSQNSSSDGELSDHFKSKQMTGGNTCITLLN